MNSQSTSLAGNSTEVLREGLAAGEAAEKSGDSKRALQIYTELQDRFPGATMPFLRAAAMLRRNRRFEDAEACS